MTAMIDDQQASAYVSGVPDPNDLIRNAILAEYEKRGLNPYQLWKLVEGSGVSRATVYAFVNGKTTLNTEHATKMMDALDLHVVSQKAKRPSKK